jgi:hypothetical protein
MIVQKKLDLSTAFREQDEAGGACSLSLSPLHLASSIKKIVALTERNYQVY